MFGFVNRIVNFFSNTYNTDIIFLTLLTIAILFVFFINIFKVYNFTQSRYNKVMEPVSTKMNINESLNIEYCNVNFENNIAINNNNFVLLTIYLIITILLWANYMTELFSNVKINNEIKIIGFSKYFNKDLTSELEYNYLIIFSYIILFLYSIYLIIYLISINGYNESEIYTLNNLKLYNDTLINYIDYDLYNRIVNEYEFNSKVPELNNDNKLIYGLSINTSTDDNLTDEDIHNRVKTLITYLLLRDDEFQYIYNKCRRELKGGTGDTTGKQCSYLPPKCMYPYIANVNKEPTIRSFDEIPGKVKNYLRSDMTSIKKELFEKTYTDIRNNLIKYSENINSKYDDNIFYYKLELIFLNIPAIVISILLLIVIFSYLWSYSLIMANNYNIIEEMFNDVDYVKNFVLAGYIFVCAFIINL
jgi:hypothetical protein